MLLSTTLKRFAMVGAAATLLTATATAQPGGRGGFGGAGGRGGFGGPGGGMTGLLMSGDVRDELEISDEQLADLRSMGEEMRDQMRSMFQGMRDLSPEERRERFESMRADMEDMRLQAEDRMGEILLPHQMARLREINLQQQVRRGGLQGALRGELAEELGLSEQQREDLAAKAEELQQDMQEKIEQLRNDAREELMSLLTPDQRSKLESMMGSDFEMQQRGFDGRRGGPGGGRERGRRGRPAAE